MTRRRCCCGCNCPGGSPFVKQTGAPNIKIVVSGLPSNLQNYTHLVDGVNGVRYRFDDEVNGLDGLNGTYYFELPQTARGCPEFSGPTLFESLTTPVESFREDRTLSSCTILNTASGGADQDVLVAATPTIYLGAEANAYAIGFNKTGVSRTHLAFLGSLILPCSLNWQPVPGLTTVLNQQTNLFFGSNPIDVAADGTIWGVWPPENNYTDCGLNSGDGEVFAIGSFTAELVWIE